jgi:hypothetical protein
MTTIFGDFLPFFVEKMACFSFQKCYDPIFAQILQDVQHKNADFLVNFFDENVFEIVTLTPGYCSALVQASFPFNSQENASLD